MAIQGKKLYQVYLDEENAEYVKAFLESKRGEGGLSALVDGMIKNTADTLRESGVGGSNKKLNWVKMLRMVFNGIKKG